MPGFGDVVTSIVDRKNGPGLLRQAKTTDNPLFALAGNVLGFGRGLLPNSGLLENRSEFEWEMGCLSWQQAGAEERAAEAEAEAQKAAERSRLGNLSRSVGSSLRETYLEPLGFGAEGGVPPPKAIKFRVNPSDVQWTMRQRSQEQKTKAGTVLHVWNDNTRKTYYDEPVLTFKFESGNILPTRSILDFDGSIPSGLNNFYEFLSLVDEVKVLDDGRANLCYIDYNSLIFPSIRLWGFWTPNGVSFADQATNHAQVNNWTASFTVYKSFPEIGRAIETINQSITDGSQAGASLQKMYAERVSWTYANRRSETFGMIQDITGNIQGVITGQVPPSSIASAGKASIEAASQRVVARASTALAGAVAGAVSGIPNAPRASGGGMNS